MTFQILRPRSPRRLFFSLFFLIILSSVVYKFKWFSYSQDLNQANSFLGHKSLKIDETKLANAVILIMCRNSDLEGMRRTMRKFEDRFNRKFNYPYVFLNEEEFSDVFKKIIQYETEAEVSFSLIPKEHWEVPSWINTTKFEHNMQILKGKNVPYADKVSYHKMCRYQSGPIFLHPALKKYEYYWRIEPDTDFYCDINYDPFQWLIENKKMYGFTISLHEVPDSITTLFTETISFMRQYKKSLETSLFPFFLDPTTEKNIFSKKEGTFKSRLGHSQSAGVQKFNLCHFWSNFEIAALSLFQSPVYQDYFNYLDGTGGFYYERWGDAPVHSLGLGMMLDFKQVHRFEDIGYKHADFSVCPSNSLSDPTSAYRCQCPIPLVRDFYSDPGSCLPRFKNYQPVQFDLDKFTEYTE